MTRKDYIRIAAALALARVNVTDPAVEAGITRAARHIADALEEEKPHFHRYRFFKAQRGITA